MTNAEFREVLEDRTAKYAVEVFKYLRDLPYDVSPLTHSQLLHSSTFLPMSPNRRIFLNIVATYGRSLDALVCGLFISRRLLAAGKSEFGVCGVVGGMMVIELLAGKMRLDRGGIVAVEDDMRQTYTVKHIRKGLTLLSLGRKGH